MEIKLFSYDLSSFTYLPVELQLSLRNTAIQ